MGVARLPLLRFRIAASISPRLFSSSAAAIRRPWNSSVTDSECLGEASHLYKSALKIQRPTVVGYRNILPNYVSLIGTIEYPLRRCKSQELGFHTFLRVKATPGASHHLQIMLKFWDEMAEISGRHLKPDDLVYVSGHLESYVKDTEIGKQESCYEVVVKELNFVTQQHLGSPGKNFEKHGPEPEMKLKSSPKLSVEDRKQRCRDRLHLWHIFFASPHEWWDNRRCKLNPKAPDFVHKDTRETLWLRDNDPPWVAKQLQLYDSKFGKQNPGAKDRQSHLSPMVCDDT